jgi:hypothetical protein
MRHGRTSDFPRFAGGPVDDITGRRVPPTPVPGPARRLRRAATSPSCEWKTQRLVTIAPRMVRTSAVAVRVYLPMRSLSGWNSRPGRGPSRATHKRFHPHEELG